MIAPAFQPRHHHGQLPRPLPVHSRPLPQRLPSMSSGSTPAPSPPPRSPPSPRRPAAPASPSSPPPALPRSACPGARRQRGHRLRRQTSHFRTGGPYTTVTSVTSTSYIDTGLTFRQPALLRYHRAQIPRRERPLRRGVRHPPPPRSPPSKAGASPTSAPPAVTTVLRQPRRPRRRRPAQPTRIRPRLVPRQPFARRPPARLHPERPTPAFLHPHRRPRPHLPRPGHHRFHRPVAGDLVKHRPRQPSGQRHRPRHVHAHVHPPPLPTPPSHDPIAKKEGLSQSTPSAAKSRPARFPPFQLSTWILRP